MKMADSSLNIECAYCHQCHPLVPTKKYCIICAEKMYMECRTCHMPKAEAQYTKGSQRCDSCQTKYVKQKAKRGKKKEEEIEMSSEGSVESSTSSSGEEIPPPPPPSPKRKTKKAANAKSKGVTKRKPATVSAAPVKKCGAVLEDIDKLKNEIIGEMKKTPASKCKMGFIPFFL